MSLSEKRKKEIKEEEKYRHAVVTSIRHGGHTSSQKHGVPLILSIFIPGLGQLVKGQVKKGFLIFFAPVFAVIFLLISSVGGNGSYFLASLGNAWIAWFILYVWQLIDAYNN